MAGFVPPIDPQQLARVQQLGGAPQEPSFQVRPVAPPSIPGGGYDPAAVPPPVNPQQQLNDQFAAPPPVPQAQPGDDVRLSEGGGNNSEAIDDRAAGAVDRQNLRDYILDLSPGAKAPQFIRPEGESYTGVGGEHGKEWFDEALDKGPKRLEAAIKQSEDAQAAKSAALGKFYDQEATRQAGEAAAMQHSRQQDQDELRNRQRNLDQATSFYTDDLANQGKFWQNPGNVLSAIAYSLMPIFANDPTIGIRTVNQAIDQDMARRQHAASQTLGALSSNLHGYRQIIGDRQAGDLLASSEARRVAANEVERIGQKFESQISKAKMQAIVEDLRNKSVLQKIEAYKALGVHQDAKAMPKALFDARGQGFEGEWRRYGNDPTRLQSTGAAVNGTIGGTPSVAASDGGKMSAQEAAIFSSPKLTLQAVISGRVPGGLGMADVFKRSIARQAAAESGYASTGDDKAYAKAKVAIMDKAEKDVQGFAPLLAPIAQQKAGITMLQRDIDIISRSEKNPDELLNNIARSVLPNGAPQWMENMSRLLSSTPMNKAEALAKEKAEAAMRFRSLFADSKVDYYHSKAGANQSTQELSALQEVVHSASSFNQIKAFTDIQSRKLNDQATVILAGASNPIAAMLYQTQTGIGLPPLPSKGVAAPHRGMQVAKDQPMLGLGDVNNLVGAPKANINRGGIDYSGITDKLFNTSSARPPEPLPPPPEPRGRQR